MKKIIESIFIYFFIFASSIISYDEIHLTFEEIQNLETVMNKMEFNFIENHGLKVQASNKVFGERKELNINIYEGLVQVCQIKLDLPFDFNECHRDEKCYDQVEKCAMKYDRKDYESIQEKKEQKKLETEVIHDDVIQESENPNTNEKVSSEEMSEIHSL